VSDNDGGVFITPPPGLFPNAPAAVPTEPHHGLTESGTHKFARPAEATRPSVAPPAFFAAPLGAQPRQTALTLQRDDGTQHVITAAAVFGRNPAAAGEWAGALAVALPDGEKSMSKTHAGVRVTAGGSSIVDLNSTNGTVVLRPEGAEEELVPGVPVSVRPGDVVMLGKVVVRVVA
jgi:hypothetical protein